MTTHCGIAISRGLLRLTLLAVSAFTLSFFETQPALAQDKAPVILVVDQALILRESKAGKDLYEKTKKLSEEMNAGQEKERQAIQKEEQELKNQLQMLSEEIREQRLNQLRKRTQDYQLTAQIKQSELTQTNAKATGEIVEAIKPIYTDIFKERNATMLIDRAQLIAVSPDIDITAEVLKRLDQKIQTVKFERVKVTVKKEGQ